MTKERFTKSVVALATLVLCGGCSDNGTGPNTPTFDPSNFVAGVTNPFFTLLPGRIAFYEGQADGASQTDSVEVLSETKTILGVVAAVVHDRVYTEGSLTEDTFDWYAQDKDGNVWYLGEDTKELEDGQVVSTEGSWEAGVNGAEAGIIMWADPARPYRRGVQAGVRPGRGRRPWEGGRRQSECGRALRQPGRLRQDGIGARWSRASSRTSSTARTSASRWSWACKGQTTATSWWR